MDRLPDDIAAAIADFERELGWLEEYGDCRQLSVQFSRERLEATILKHINGGKRGQTFPCPKCGVTRSWLPACAQEECPLLGFDGKPLSRFTDLGRAALSDNRSQTKADGV